LPLLLWLFAAPALAADILSAVYDARTDRIIVELAYRGTRPDHDLTVQWGSCKDSGVTARLIDRQRHDEAQRDFRVTRRISLAAIPCRPAVVTLRLGRVSHMSVGIPEGR
jgi:hypothetical protein